jgi:hypothetical protein
LIGVLMVVLVDLMSAPHHLIRPFLGGRNTRRAGFPLGGAICRYRLWGNRRG